MKYLLLLVLLCCTLAPADEAEEHFAAHFGLSFAISTAVYGFAEKGMRCRPAEAFLFAAATTLLIGAVYKFTEVSPNDPQWGSSFGRAMLYNAAGVGAAGLTIAVFKF